MLLLVTILLVLIAAVTLLIGIFSDNLALIFISIGASALAAIVLGVLSQVSKRKGREATGATGPEPLPAREPQPARVAEQAARDIERIGEPVSAAAPSSSSSSSASSSSSSAALPIADYDSLRVNEILPALDALDLDQLEAVAQHEETNKNRTTVLNRIDDLMDELEAQEAGGGAAVAADDEATAIVESIETIGEPAVAPVASAAAGSSGGFPIPNYDDLDEDELIAMFEELDADQLEAVADREEAGKNRDAVLDAIDDRLDILEGIVPAPAPAAAAAPAKKAATKAAAPAKKTPVKAAAKKTAVTPPTATRKAAAPAPVKKTAAAKKSTPAPAKKAAAPAATKKAASAPAKKSATKAPAKKATAAAKAPAKKAATATKKAATTAKKAAPVKKATAAKKTSKR